MKQLGTVGYLVQLGWVVAFATLIPLGGGLWLDRQVGTAPLFTLIGAVVGIAAGTIGVVRVALRQIGALSPPEESQQPTSEVAATSEVSSQNAMNGKEGKA